MNVNKLTTRALPYCLVFSILAFIALDMYGSYGEEDREPHIRDQVNAQVDAYRTFQVASTISSLWERSHGLDVMPAGDRDHPIPKICKRTKKVSDCARLLNVSLEADLRAEDPPTAFSKEAAKLVQASVMGGKIMLLFAVFALIPKIRRRPDDLHARLVQSKAKMDSENPLKHLSGKLEDFFEKSAAGLVVPIAATFLIASGAALTIPALRPAATEPGKQITAVAPPRKMQAAPPCPLGAEAQSGKAVSANAAPPSPDPTAVGDCTPVLGPTPIDYVAALNSNTEKLTSLLTEVEKRQSKEFSDQIAKFDKQLAAEQKSSGDLETAVAAARKDLGEKTAEVAKFEGKVKDVQVALNCIDDGATTKCPQALKEVERMRTNQSDTIVELNRVERSLLVNELQRRGKAAWDPRDYKFIPLPPRKCTDGDCEAILHQFQQDSVYDLLTQYDNWHFGKSGCLDVHLKRMGAMGGDVTPAENLECPRLKHELSLNP